MLTENSVNFQKLTFINGTLPSPTNDGVGVCQYLGGWRREAVYISGIKFKIEDLRRIWRAETNYRETMTSGLRNKLLKRILDFLLDK